MAPLNNEEFHIQALFRILQSLGILVSIGADGKTAHATSVPQIRKFTCNYNYMLDIYYVFIIVNLKKNIYIYLSIYISISIVDE